MSGIFPTRPPKFKKSCSEFTKAFIFDWLNSLGKITNAKPVKHFTNPRKYCYITT